MVELLTFILLNFIAMISPGPDFAIVTKYGLSGSRRSAVSASLGVASALVIHVIYCVSGIALILSSSPKLLLLIRFLGGGYLLYLGMKTILSLNKEDGEVSNRSKNAFLAGFLCNLLNPKATVFLLSLFAQFAAYMKTAMVKFAYAASIPLMAALYFCFLSVFITHEKFFFFFQRIKKYFIAAMGAFLVLLGAIGLFTAIKGYLQLS